MDRQKNVEKVCIITQQQQPNLGKSQKKVFFFSGPATKRGGGKGRATKKDFLRLPLIARSFRTSKMLVLRVKIIMLMSFCLFTYVSAGDKNTSGKQQQKH